MTFSAIAHNEVTAKPGQALSRDPNLSVRPVDSVARPARDNHFPRWLTREAGMAEGPIG